MKSATHTYYRIQPTGLGVDHLSEDSAGDCLWLHVFLTPAEVIHCEERPEVYGDEVVIISSPSDYWDNGDVEGWAIRPDGATVVARYSLPGFARLVAAEVGELEAPWDEIDDDEIWDAVRHPDHYWE